MVLPSATWNERRSRRNSSPSAWAITCAGKRYSARRLVQQFPDAALVVLRDPKSVNASPDTLVAIADAHDQQCHRGDGPAWGAVARDRAAQPSRYADFDEKRRQFMIHVQNGHVKEAQRLGLAAPNLRRGRRLRSTC